MNAMGIDLLSIARVERLMRHHSFWSHLFTLREKQRLELKPNPLESIAGVLCAKEAVAKALHTGLGSVLAKEIEIIGVDVPQVVLHGKAQRIFAAMGGEDITLSISHEGGMAIAVAVLSTVSQRLSFRTEHVDQELAQSLVRRDRQGYKTQYGRVAIIGGSEGMIGALCLSVRAAMRVGAGLVYAVVPKSIAPIVQMKLTEAIVVAVEDEGRGHFLPQYVPDILERISTCHCVAIGPGLGRSSSLPLWMKLMTDKLEMPLILDADALYALAQDRSIFQSAKHRWAITPHEMEMSRLTGYTLPHIRAQRSQISTEFAEKHACYVVLKGSATVITDGHVHYLNGSGNPGMATAGMGDVLTGMMAGYVGYGYPLFRALRLACYIHGLAGDLAAQELGEDGLIASDVIERIPLVVRALRRWSDQYGFE